MGTQPAKKKTVHPKLVYLASALSDAGKEELLSTVNAHASHIHLHRTAIGCSYAILSQQIRELSWTDIARWSPYVTVRYFILLLSLLFLLFLLQFDTLLYYICLRSTSFISNNYVSFSKSRQSLIETATSGFKGLFECSMVGDVYCFSYSFSLFCLVFFFFSLSLLLLLFFIGGIADFMPFDLYGMNREWEKEPCIAIGLKIVKWVYKSDLRMLWELKNEMNPLGMNIP